MLSWAADTHSWIIEDDYHSEFRYTGRPFPALACLDTQGRTLYIGSFAKVFSNGLRLGFIVMPAGLISRFADSLRRFGSKASVTPQRPLALFMKSGDYYRHIRRVRKIYSERRRHFIELLKTHLGDYASFDDHRTGMQIAVKLPDKLKDTEIVAAAAGQGVSCCTALSNYNAKDSGLNGLLMGFCGYTKEEMSNAMERLRRVIDDIKA